MPCRTGRAAALTGRSATRSPDRRGRGRDIRRTGLGRCSADSNASSSRRPRRDECDARVRPCRSDTGRQPRRPRRTAKSWFPHRHTLRRADMAYPARPGWARARERRARQPVRGCPAAAIPASTLMYAGEWPSSRRLSVRRSGHRCRVPAREVPCRRSAVRSCPPFRSHAMTLVAIRAVFISGKSRTRVG